MLQYKTIQIICLKTQKCGGIEFYMSQHKFCFICEGYVLRDCQVFLRVHFVYKTKPNKSSKTSFWAQFLVIITALGKA